MQPSNTSALNGLIAPYRIRDFGGGQQVAIISLTTSTTQITSSPDPGTTFLEEVAAAQAAVDEVTAMGVDKVVLLTHIGYSQGLTTDDFDIAGIDGVDVVVGGHSHSLLADDPMQVAALGNVHGPYPTAFLRETDNGQVCIVQAWEYGHGVGMLTIDFDATGNVTACSGRPLFPFDAFNYSPEDAVANVTANLTAYLESLEVFVATEPDTATAEALAPYADGVMAFGNETIAMVPEPGICYERIPGQGRSRICTAEETASQGGGACNLVAQAFLDQVPVAELAIQNGGGCRTDIFPGEFKVVDAVNMLPFSNTMVTLELTGEQIVLVLNQAIQASAVTGESTGAYPYAAGLRFHVDITQEFPNYLSNVEVNPRFEGMWEPIDLMATYIVVTNSFIAGGRDNYSVFGEIPEEDVTDQFLEYAQVFIQYAIDVGVLEDPPLDTYSTQSYTGMPDDDMPTMTMAPTITPTMLPPGSTFAPSPQEEDGDATPSPMDDTRGGPSSAASSRMTNWVLLTSTTVASVFMWLR